MLLLRIGIFISLKARKILPDFMPSDCSIFQLPSLVVNQIAAGEVIERPASALKELLENSLDAGATQIAVVVEKGGIEMLSVRDNGSGIQRDDLPLAITRYATSKISSIADLESVRTMGFRGEALASIAAISELTLSSRIPNEDHGWRMTVARHSEPTSPEPIQLSLGTEIVARKFFSDIPARRKFLKSSGTEWSHIQTIFIRFAIGNPNIALSLKHGQKLRWNLPAQSMQERAAEFLGQEFVCEGSEISLNAGHLSINGILCIREHASTSGLTNRQFFYLDGRFIRDKIVRKAILSAMQDIAPRGDGEYVLFLSTPPGLVDVNAHPGKLEVRFRESKALFSLIRHAVLGTFSKPLGSSLAKGRIEPIPSQENPDQDKGNSNIPYESKPNTLTHQLSSSDFYVDSRAQRKETRGFSKPISDLIDFPKEISEMNFGEDVQKHPHLESPLDDQSLGQPIGQLHDIYILSQSKAGLIIVDMHAAHERIIYEELKSVVDQDGKVAQILLEPIVFSITPTMIDALKKHWNHLLMLGFDFELVEQDKLKVSALPNLLRDIDVKSVLSEVLEELAQFGMANATEAARNTILSGIACRSAVKANRKLTLDEMDTLLRKMEVTERSGRCNHGRPCWHLIEMNYLDRIFMRGQ